MGGFIVNSKQQNNENSDNVNSEHHKAEIPNTPTSQRQNTSFIKLSVAKYSNQSRRASMLSPFGSKKKTKKFEYNDNENNLNVNEELNNLKKEHKEIKRKYIALKDGENEFKQEIIRKYNKKENDLKLEIEGNKENERKYREEIKYKNEEINE